MKPILLTIALCAALGAASAQNYPYNNDRRYDDRGNCNDNGSQDWRVVEQRVWVPAQRVSNGIFTRTIPGHYEIRRDRVRVYRNDNDDRYYNKSYKHKKGMPYGQWKKQRRDDDRDGRGRWNGHDRD